MKSARRQLIRQGVAALLLALGSTGCAEEGTVIEIRYSPVPEPNCRFTASQAGFRSVGVFDVTLGSSFFLPLNIRSNMERVSTDPAGGFNDRPLQPEANAVNLMGYDVCWIRGDDSRVTALDSHEKGFPVPCEDHPAEQRRFVASSAHLEPQSVTVGTVPSLLTEPDLQAPGIFGANFDPDNIPMRGAEQVGEPFSFLGDRDDPTEAWGQFPPGTISTPVILQVRATGKTQSGMVVRSNWFVYPVEVCVGCVMAECGPAILVDCPSGEQSFSGNVLSFENTCYPAQAYEPQCEAASGC